MEGEKFYTDLRDNTKEPTFFFMLNCVLMTRAETGDLADEDAFEQETNIYLANLLSAFSDPSYIEKLKPYLSDYDIEVFRRLQNSNDARLKYTIYKANADFLLFSIGIFDGSNDRFLPSGARYHNGKQGKMGRGQTYYHFAFSYSQRLPDLGQAIPHVLEHLSKGFEKYVTILSYLRGEYFDIIERLSEGEIYHLMRSVQASGKVMKLENKRNQFLDAYLTWKKLGTKEALLKVKEIAEELRNLDSDFTYRPE
ncbi:MAG: hypothetical protein ACUVQ7_07085 [bacterium]